MDMDQAAVFLAGTILTSIGFLIIIGAIITMNNMIHKWWKPLGWFKDWGLLVPFEHIEPTISKNTK